MTKLPTGAETVPVKVGCGYPPEVIPRKRSKVGGSDEGQQFEDCEKVELWSHVRAGGWRLGAGGWGLGAGL